MKRKITYIIQSKLYRVREYSEGKERTVGCFKSLDEAKVCQAGHHWIGGGLTPDLENNFGFIYLIEDFLTGMKYIGKKQYYFYNGKCKSSNDITSEGFVKEAWDESDWRYYKSSSKILAPIITERPNDFYFEIIEQCESKLDLLTREIDWQKSYDVLNATMDNGEREYFNQNIGSCEFNIHESGEVVRAIRYNPLYQAWDKMMKQEDISDPWKDPKEFIKENEKKAKGMSKPMVVRVSSGPLSSFNAIIVNTGEVYKSKKYKGVGCVEGEWVGRLSVGGETLEVKGVSERQAAVELDNLIDAKGLGLEKQIEWV